MSESNLACLTHTPKVFVKLHKKVLIYGIHKEGAIVIIYTIVVSYAITKPKIQCAHVGHCEQSQFSDPVNFVVVSLNNNSHCSYANTKYVHQKFIKMEIGTPD
jgi:hypothetical protein